MKNNFSIRHFQESDIPTLVQAFAEHHWHKPASIFEAYWQEQQQGQRMMWLSFVGEKLAGYVTLAKCSKYPFFAQNQIPEIMDLNVLPPYRNQGIGSQLLDTAESEAKNYGAIIGIGVGLYPDYGAAQNLYIKRGYIPDGHGIAYNYQTLAPGSPTVLDDDLVLWLTKSFSF